jgi:hypothetical protein
MDNCEDIIIWLSINARCFFFLYATPCSEKLNNKRDKWVEPRANDGRASISPHPTNDHLRILIKQGFNSSRSDIIVTRSFMLFRAYILQAKNCLLVANGFHLF